MGDQFVAYRDAEYTLSLYPMITLPKFLKILSLPKVLARISNVWVHMWGIMQIICNSLKPIKHCVRVFLLDVLCSESWMTEDTSSWHYNKPFWLQNIHSYSKFIQAFPILFFGIQTSQPNLSIWILDQLPSIPQVHKLNYHSLYKERQKKTKLYSLAFSTSEAHNNWGRGST